MQVFSIPPTTQEPECPTCGAPLVQDINELLDTHPLSPFFEQHIEWNYCTACDFSDDPLTKNGRLTFTPTPEMNAQTIQNLGDDYVGTCPVCGAPTVADNHWEHGYVGPNGAEGPDYWQFQSCTRCDWSDEYKHHENEELPF